MRDLCRPSRMAKTEANNPPVFAKAIRKWVAHAIISSSPRVEATFQKTPEARVSASAALECSKNSAKRLVLAQRGCKRVTKFRAKRVR